jgi:hypothetical protein
MACSCTVTKVTHNCFGGGGDSSDGVTNEECKSGTALATMPPSRFKHALTK